MAQPVNFLVDSRILFNLSIRVRNIRFRLIVVIIRNKILHRILRKELPEF